MMSNSGNEGMARNEWAYLSVVKRLLGSICLLASAATATGQQYDAPVEARVPVSPALVKGSDGRAHAAYEMHVTNFYATSGPLRLTELRVFPQGSSDPVASYKGKELCALVKPKCAEGADAVTLPAGTRAVLFLWLSLPKNTPPISGVWHTMVFQDAKGQERSLHGVEVTLALQPAMVIEPPLRGDHNWLVSEGAGNAHSHHWGSLLALNGVVTLPQRFAIDFVGLNGQGHALPVTLDSPRASKNPEWFGYDAEVLAVADGVVRDSRDGEPDGQPLTKKPESTNLTARGLYGNFVVLEIAPGVFAHYAHLRPGSVGVHASQHVHRGDVIAHLGDSGNSAAPHLHFHISNKPVFEESEGLPFRFAHFTLEGHAGEEVVLSPSSVWTPHPVEQRDIIPLDSDVIAFP